MQNPTSALFSSPSQTQLVNLALLLPLNILAALNLQSRGLLSTLTLIIPLHYLPLTVTGAARPQPQTLTLLRGLELMAGGLSIPLCWSSPSAASPWDYMLKPKYRGGGNH